MKLQFCLQIRDLNSLVGHLEALLSQKDAQIVRKESLLQDAETEIHNLKRQRQQELANFKDQVDRLGTAACTWSIEVEDQNVGTANYQTSFQMI